MHSSLMRRWRKDDPPAPRQMPENRIAARAETSLRGHGSKEPATRRASRHRVSLRLQRQTGGASWPHAQPRLRSSRSALSSTARHANGAKAIVAASAAASWSRSQESQALTIVGGDCAAGREGGLALPC